MTKINKSKLFKMAWSAFKNDGKGRSFSSALKWAWSTIKEESKKIVHKATVIKETAKAVMIQARCFRYDLGGEYYESVWLPKSQIEIVEGGIIIPEWILSKINNFQRQFKI